jgi:type II secretion system protein N
MVSLEARLKGGTLQGKVSLGEDYVYIDLAANSLPLEELKFLESLGKIAPVGKLSGEVLFETELKNLAASEGVFNLKSKQLALRELSIATTMGDLKFENLNFNDLVFAGQIDKGKVALKNVKIAGGSIFGNVSGSVALAKKFDLSTADLTLQFKVDDDLQKRFGIILDQFIPNKSDDGFYVMQLSDSLSTFTESFGSKKPGRPPRLNPPMEGMDREEEPLSEPAGPPIPNPEPMNDPEAAENGDEAI